MNNNVQRFSEGATLAQTDNRPCLKSVLQTFDFQRRAIRVIAHDDVHVKGVRSSSLLAELIRNPF